MTEIKPTALKQGMPKAERNGLFGNEERLIELARAGKSLVAIVTFTLPKVIHDEIADEIYPVADMAHIEPMFDDKSEAAAIKLRDTAYKVRTGENALDLGGDFE